MQTDFVHLHRICRDFQAVAAEHPPALGLVPGPLSMEAQLENARRTLANMESAIATAAVQVNGSGVGRVPEAMF